MLRLAAVGLLAALACGAGNGAAPGTEGPATLRVVTWNVHDLFDEFDRTDPPGADDTVPSRAAVEAKLARVGGVLAPLDADVILLQEVENLGLLERLARGALAGRGYAAYLRDGYDPRGIDLGVLARVPVEEVRSHLGDVASGGGRLWSRDLLEVRLDSGQRRVILLANHLVSRLDPAADDRRREQAARVREVLDRLRADPAGPLVVVMGDLNDLPTSAALRPLLADGVLLDLGASLPPEGSWTWAGAGARERIDYVLVPAGDASFVLNFEVVEGAAVAAASDHRPLVIDLWPGVGLVTETQAGGETMAPATRYAAESRSRTPLEGDLCPTLTRHSRRAR